MPIKITQNQAPQFRALIKTHDEGRLFDKVEDLATQDELNAEGLVGVYPAAYTVYKSTGGITPYIQDVANASPVEGYINREINATAFKEPTEVEANNLNYNFIFTPENRATFAFKDVGAYFVDFKIMPKTGGAIIFRVPIQVT